MKISLQWLNEYLPGPLVAAELAESLTHGGLPVEVIETMGDDTVIDVEVTSNRGDCLSHLGVAKELSALLDRPFKDVLARPAEAGRPVLESVWKQEDTGISARCLPEGRKCAEALAFKVVPPS